MLRKLTIIVLVLVVISASWAQELNCNVILDDSQVQTQEQQTLDNLEQVIWEFMNNTQWTEDDYLPEERINCNLVITLTSANVSAGSYTGNAQIQASRPVYGSDYESLTFNFVDKHFEFGYLPGDIVQFNLNIYNSNLTSMLAFYAYMILGMDYDTYSELGGTQYFDNARTVINIAQGNSGSDGWKESQGPNNRYWLMDNANSPQFEPVRKGMYTYHRIALDQLPSKPTEGQEAILTVLDEIQKLRRVVPVSIYLTTFFMSKTDELVNIYGPAPAEMKTKAADVLSKVDPTNTQRYQEMKTK